MACTARSIYTRESTRSVGRSTATGTKFRSSFSRTVYDSKFTNIKELRVQHRGKPLRAFFAFDPLRQAIVLCIGDKGGKKRFYKEMLDIADQQYEIHLSTLGDQSNG